MAAGAKPGDIDYALLTHLHADHVGWNTDLSEARWNLTFRRARLSGLKIENDYCAALDKGMESGAAAHIDAAFGQATRKRSLGVYDGSVQPNNHVERADIIALDGSEVL